LILRSKVREVNMRHALPDPLLAGASGFVAERMGLHFPPERWRDLERGITAAAADMDLPDAETCARTILSTSLTHTQIEVLASHLTVGETYFFREKNTFAALEEHILPQLLRARRSAERRLRIWSAGCCTGEEPYSLAILLDRLIPDFGEWHVTVLATDINPRFLRKAAEGVYSEWSFRDTPSWIRDRYFTRRRDGRYELQPRIRGRVTFSHLNLADDTYPSLISNTNAMDLILCRNVLMYFTAERAQQVAVKFRRALVSGGWLIVSPTETSNALFAPLTPVQFPGVLLYRNAVDELPLPAVFEAHQPEPQIPCLLDTVAAPVKLLQESTEIESVPPSAQTPDDAGEHVSAARCCAGEGRLGEAIAWCEKAIEADRLNPAHYYLLAIILQEQGQVEAASQSLARALYLAPDFALAHFALGNLRLSQGRRSEADRHLANALTVLERCAQQEILPEADGLTAGRLVEIIVSVRASWPHTAAQDERA